MRVYISGAITGRPTEEYKTQFNEAERRLWDEGYETINPAKLDLICPDTFEHGDYMDICMVFLKKCDAIYMLPGWQKSAGAQEEIHWAAMHNMDLMGDVMKPTREVGLNKGDKVRILQHRGVKHPDGTIATILAIHRSEDHEPYFCQTTEGETCYWYAEDEIERYIEED